MFTIPADEQAADVLNAINAWCAAQGGTQARLLWDVLTALRGPDLVGPASVRLKDSTTLVFRRIALPANPSGVMMAPPFKSAAQAGSALGAIEPYTSGAATAHAPFGWMHFAHHARVATDALAHMLDRGLLTIPDL